MVEEYFRLLEEGGVPRGDSHTVLATTESEEAEAAAWLEHFDLGAAEPLFGIHPGSSFGPSKLWYPEKFAAVADGLTQRWGGRVVVFCGPTEQGLARSIAALARRPLVTAADDPLSLGALKAVVRRLTLLVSTDTGPRHLGPAFDIPTVVLMGATDPRFTNTNLGRSLVVRSGVECSPCQRKVCPIDHRCMTRLEPAHVFAAVRRLLSG
jgi:heptosyltransferase-2